MLDQQKKFVGCVMDSQMLTAAEAVLAVAFASQVRYPKSDIIGSVGVIGASKRTKEKSAAVLAGKYSIVCEILPGLGAAKVLHGHVLHFNSAMLENYVLYQMCRLFPVDLSSPVWRSRSESADRKALLPQECGRLGVST